MRRLGLVLLAIIFVCSFFACTAQNGSEVGAAGVTPTAEIDAVVDDPLAAIQSAATVEEVVPYHKAALEAGDYETAITCAERMLELEPGSQDALNALTEANFLRLQADADALNAAIGRGVSEAEDTAAYAGYATRLLEGLDVTFDVPFVSDYGAAENANTSGITFSNLMQRGVYTAWQGGLLTAQTDWVYFSVPGEDWAIYKIREDGAKRTRLGEACGCYLNVVGDWLYYCNMADGNRIYKVRTDGNENQKVSEDTGRYLAVIDDWMYYAVESEDYNLYRSRLDGSERTMLSGEPTREAYCTDGVLYTALRDEGGIYRANPDASEPRLLSAYDAGSYFEYEGSIYLLTDVKGLVIFKMSPDGTGEEALIHYGVNIAAFTIAGGKLIVTGRAEKDQEEGIAVFDLTTMEPGIFIPCWCEGLYTDKQDTVYFVDCEDNTWHWLNAETGETGTLN